MQVLVVVIEQMRWILRVLYEALDGVLGEELAVGLSHPPEELRVELARRRRREEVHLAVEDVEDFIQSCRNVPPAQCSDEKMRSLSGKGKSGHHGNLPFHIEVSKDFTMELRKGRGYSPSFCFCGTHFF